eukprot:TRINITY_DN91991_c0_g1_i1.p1 TRINITY_DN91991_c0_g1~~TRINITY_DN91991_c0_g1_i1.p1  ORF type:complete len:509 (-),score=66.85 TRINITY_DN91991_c0_g1_i1:55-1515(-)
MHRLARLSKHIFEGGGTASSIFQELTSGQSSDPRLALAEAEYRNGTGSLWTGSRSHIQRALDIYLEEGWVKFPVVDTNAEAQAAIRRLHALLTSCEAESPRLPAAPWQTRKLLITGATGFVGIHVLDRLIKVFPRAEIYCLVRGKSVEHCQDRLRKAAASYRLDIGNARAVPGDCRQPGLGLPSEDYRELVAEVDTVLHFAAKDNFFLPYEILRSIHVDGALNVIEFCARGRIKSLMFMSSCKYRLIERLERRAEPNDGLYDGYAQSKFVGHCLAEEVHRLRCQGSFLCAPPISLVNLGYVYPDGTPTVVPDISDAWEVVMKICLQSNSVPDIQVPMDYVAVSYVAGCLVEILNDLSSGAKASNDPSTVAADAWHEIYHPNGLQWRDIVSCLQEYRAASAGPAFDFLPMPAFAENWRRHLFEEVGSERSKFMAASMSSSFEEQCRIVFSVDDKKLYRSTTIPTPSPVCRRYLLNLIQLIDKEMSLA